MRLLPAEYGKGFAGAPRPLGFDEQGREVLTFLEGETVGNRKHASSTCIPAPGKAGALDEDEYMISADEKDLHPVTLPLPPQPDEMTSSKTQARK